MDRSIKIAPSILVSNFANFGLECEAFEAQRCDWVQADVLVAGSAVFKGGSVDNPEPYDENIHAIRAAAQVFQK